MITAIYTFMIILHIWFFGCVISYKIGDWILVEGTGIRGIEFKWWIIYSTASLIFIKYIQIGKWILPIFLLLWLVLQFYSHWYYTFFGATAKKIKGYNKCFKNTINIISPSENFLFPDLYHVILHIIILAFFLTTILYLF